MKHKFIYTITTLSVTSLLGVTSSLGTIQNNTNQNNTNLQKNVSPVSYESRTTENNNDYVSSFIKKIIPLVKFNDNIDVNIDSRMNVESKEIKFDVGETFMGAAKAWVGFGGANLGFLTGDGGAYIEGESMAFDSIKDIVGSIKDPMVSACSPKNKTYTEVKTNKKIKVKLSKDFSHINIIDNNLFENTVNMSTGAGLKRPFTFPSEGLTAVWSGDIPTSVNVQASFKNKNINIQSKNKVILTSDIKTSITNQLEDLNVIFYDDIGNRSNDKYSYLMSSYNGSLGGVNISYKIYKDYTNITLNKSLKNDFFEQILYKFDKNEAIKLINASFDVLNESDRKELKNGNNGFPWTVIDLKNNKMPSLIKYNNNLSKLFEISEIANMLDTINYYINKLTPSGGWPTTLSTFKKCICNYQFETIDEIKQIYNKYYDSFINDSYGSREMLNEVQNLVGKYQNSSTGYKNWIDSVNSWIKYNKLESLLPSKEILKKYQNFFPYEEFNEWNKFKYLTFMFLGALTSNDLYASVDVTTPDGKTKTIDTQIYSSRSGTFNNYLSNLVGDFEGGEDGATYKLTFKNFKIVNELNTRFLNADSNEMDYKSFTTFNQSNPNNLSNIELYYAPDALKYNAVKEENWTKNKSSIGVSLDKYLSELICLEDGNGHQMNEFIDNDIQNDLSKLFSGFYSYTNEHNETVYINKPIYFTVSNEGMEDQRLPLFNEIVSDISVNGLNNNFNLNLPEWNNKYFTQQEWIDSWKRFNISLDSTNKYPLFVPDQKTGEFFAIAKINNFITKPSYKDIREWFKIGKTSSIEWINKQSTNVNDGYFIVKMKACFDKKYDTDLSLKRKYKILPRQNNLSYDDNLNWFLNNAIMKRDIENGGFKYLYKTSTHVRPDSNNWFKNEEWDVNQWHFDYNKFWNDLINDPVSFESTSWTQKQADQLKKSFTQKMNDIFMSNLVKEHGKESEIVENARRKITQYNFVERYYDILTNNEMHIVGNVPYIFDENLWNNLNLYTDYIDLKMSIESAEAKGDNKELIDRFNSNKLKIWLDNNDSNQSKFSNSDVLSMFSDCKYVADNLFATIKNIDNENYDPTKPISKDNPKYYKLIVGGNPTNISYDYDFVNDNFRENFNQFSRFIRDWKSQRPSEEFKLYLDNPNYQNNPNEQIGIIQWLDENKISNQFKDEYQSIFMENFGISYINNLVNNMRIDIGDKVNDGLVFSSIEEMINDPFVNLLFEQNNIDKEKIFLKQPVSVAGTTVKEKYKYVLNNKMMRGFPFVIDEKIINGSKYYVLASDSSSLSLNVDSDFAKKMSNIAGEDKTGQKIYKVIDSDGNDMKNATSTLLKLEDTFNLIDQTKNSKDDYTVNWNWVSFFVTIGTPIIIACLVAIIMFVKKGAKQKVKF